MKTSVKDRKTYTYNEVLKKTLEYFKGDELASNIWISKYALQTKDGKFLEQTPEEMHRRMAREFARIEDKYHTNPLSREGLSEYGKRREKLTEEKIFSYLDRFKYTIPQGSIMFGLGNTEVISSLSNCVVVPSVYDSYGGIMYTDHQLVQLFKRRCGVGFDISKLRPKNMPVSNAARTTTGAVSFMHRFSFTTREVAQNGRRGALMITMDIAHPDIEDFIMVKQDLTKVTGANISIRLSDEFMQAVAEGKKYTLRWPIDSDKPLMTKEVDARELWNKIVSAAHNTAEPGLIFWDRQHYYSTSSIYPGFKNESTNPCSEIAMQGGDSCRLIALNLYSFVKNPFTPKARFDYAKFYEVVYETQHLMDDLVDLELEHIERILAKIDSDPEPEKIKRIERETWELLYNTGKRGRRTGLGFTALADAIAALGYRFDSDDALKQVEEIMRTKLQAEFDSSIDMAIERGKFADFDPEIEKQSEFVQMLEKEFPEIHQRMMQYGRRNISISTVAPTGSLSILAQTSSGIEPVFMLSYKRRKKVNPNDPNVKVDFVDDTGDAFEEFTVYHHKLKDWMKITGKKDIKESPYHGSTAPEIDWRKRVKMQALVQKYTTHSISSTINLPEDTSVDLVGKIYMEAWKQGLKGITVYRDGSRSGVLISDKKDDKKKEGKSHIKTENIQVNVFPKKRPKKLEADIIRFFNKREEWLAVVGKIDNRPYEIFTGRAEDVFSLPDYVTKGWVIKNKDEKGRSRYDLQFVDKQQYKVTIEGLSRSFDPEYWNYAKLISGVMRRGMPIEEVVKLVEGLNLSDDFINTWKNGVARALKRYIPDGTAPQDKKCPQCGDPEGLIYEEGCLVCKSCGYSKCG